MKIDGLRKILVEFISHNRWLLVFVSLCFVIFAYLTTLIEYNVIYSHYERGVYVAYARSVITELDLNILNQVPKEMQWLVTKEGYHPDHHSIGLTSILISFFYIVKLVAGAEPTTLYFFTLVGYGINFLLFILTFKSLKKLAEEFGFKFYWWVYFVLMSGAASLYFIFTLTTVIESFALPIFCIFLIHYKRILRPLTKTRFDYYLFSLSAAILILFKLMHVLIVAPFFISVLRNKKWKLQWSETLATLIVVLSFIPELYFSVVKYGKWMSPLKALKHLFFFSPGLILKKIWFGYFIPGGLFFTNPVYLIATIALVWFLYHQHKNREIGLFEALVIVGVIAINQFQFLPFPAKLLEVHLPGRIAITLFPLFFLGLSFLWEKIEKYNFTKYISLFLMVWGVYSYIVFYLTDVSTQYDWINNPVIGWEKLSYYFSLYKERLNHHAGLEQFELVTLQLYSVVLAILSILLIRISLKRHLISLAFIFILGTPLILVLNQLNHQKSMNTMREQGYYQNRVIGNGEEIFFYDYFFDSLKEVNQTATQGIKDELQNRKKKYYQIVRQQIISSTPEFDKVLESESEEFSFFFNK